MKGGVANKLDIPGLRGNAECQAKQGCHSNNGRRKHFVQDCNQEAAVRYFGGRESRKRGNREIEALKNKISKTTTVLDKRLEAIEKMLPDKLDLVELLSIQRDLQRRVKLLEENENGRSSYLRFMVGTLLAIIAIIAGILIGINFPA